MEIIHTGLYSDFAFNFMKAAVRAISDQPGRFYSKFNNVEIIQQPNGEIVFNCGKSPSSRCLGRVFNTELEAKIWFARTFKWVTKKNDMVNWDRSSIQINTQLNSTAYNVPFSCTIQETYCIYDILIERKRLELKYSKTIIDKIRGIEKDDLATALEVERRQQVNEIQNKYKRAIYDADPGAYGAAYDDISKRVAEFRKTLVAEWKEKKAKIEEQMNAEIAEINNTAKLASEGTVFPFA